MPLLEQLSRLRSNILSEEEEFADHIRLWFPVALIIGIAVGIAMSLFVIFTSLISTVLGGLPVLIAMTIGGLLVWLMVKYGFEDPANNGISYVIKKKHAKETVPLSQTQEFVSAGVAIGSGLPVGREGPALIIGSAIASTLSRWKIPEEDLHEAITIGSAAATGALFQAPFGSAVFAAEVPYKEDSDEPMLMVSFIASVVAAITLSSLIGLINSQNVMGFQVDLHLFRLGEAILEINVINSFLAFGLGMIIGFTGRGIIDMYFRYQSLLKNFFDVENRLLIGIIISLTSLFIGYLTIDNLYLTNREDAFTVIPEIAADPSSISLQILFAILLVQIIATVAIIAVGFPGGIFSPSLAIGAIMGVIFSKLLGISQTPVIIAFAIVGMSASHAAFTKTPIASILLVLEVTNLPNLIIPIILANIAAYVLSGHRSLYAGQIRSRDASLLQQLSEYDQFQEIKVVQIMTPKDKVISTTPDFELEEMRIIAMKRAKRTFPVVDENQKVIGVVSFNDIIKGLEEKKNTISEVMTKDVVSIRKEMTAREALVVILQNDVERIPVVGVENHLEGILTQQDILRGHRNLVEDYSKAGDRLFS